MKDEIKEILDRMKDDKMYQGYLLAITKKEAHLLLDYITNLQEENEILKELNVCVGCNNNPDYKSRIEKAIEYNYELQERYCHSALFDEPVASKIYEIAEKQLNILQGVDKDE